MRGENHPVGFRKLVLLSLGGFRLRLHVWPKGGGNDSRHDHRWGFISLPILGRFTETRYRAVEGDSFLRIAVADTEGMRDSERRYVSHGESNLEVERIKTRYPMVPYICRSGQIHSLVPRGTGRHASLVLTGRIKKETSDIWRRHDAVDVDLEPPE